MRSTFILSFILVLGISQTSFGVFDLEKIASAETDMDIVKLLAKPTGAGFENSNKLKDPSCLIMAYPHQITAYTAVGYQLKRVRLASTEFFYETKISGIYFQERLTLYFTFEKDVDGKRMTEESQINCSTKRTRPENGSYK